MDRELIQDDQELEAKRLKKGSHYVIWSLISMICVIVPILPPILSFMGFYHVASSVVPHMKAKQITWMVISVLFFIAQCVFLFIFVTAFIDLWKQHPGVEELLRYLMQQIMPQPKGGGVG